MKGSFALFINTTGKQYWEIIVFELMFKNCTSQLTVKIKFNHTTFGINRLELILTDRHFLFLVKNLPFALQISLCGKKCQI